MEVTKENFYNLIPELTSVINNASFISLDGEFTGLNSGNDVTSFDTPALYYHKLKEGAMNFLFFQFGMAAFQYDKSQDKYTHSAYNFYLFPRPHNRNAKDIRFMCQSSSIDFLASQGFDFNKVFREGIPYLSDPDEQDVRDQLEVKRKSLNASVDRIQIPDDLKSCVENACQQIQQFLESDKNEQELTLEKPNSFARRLVYQEAKERFSLDEVALETRNYVMFARKINGQEHRQKEEEERLEKENAEIEAAVGFTHIMRLLSKSGKLIIGHNVLLDILHIIRQFFVPLPDSYEEFKELLHSLFPKIIDTKYICAASPFKDLLTTTVLTNLLNALKEPPFSVPDVDCEDGKGYKSIDLKYHEAGFDAYVTGLVFLSLSRFLQKSCVSASKEASSIVDTPLLRPYINRLFLMRIQDTHIFLEGTDPSPSRDHVFLLTFPKDWQYKEINELFFSYGPIYIGWINDTSAWIALQHKEQTVNVKKNLLNNVNRGGVTLIHYNDYMKQLEYDDFKFSESLQLNSSFKHTLYNSPATSAARKRRSDGQKKVNDCDSVANIPSKSFGKRRGSMSGIIVDTILEEAEESPSSPKSKAKQKHSRNTCFEELDESIVSPKKKKLEFEENDAWE